MSLRSLFPLLAILPLAAGCEDASEVADVELTVDSVRGTGREVEIEASVRNRGGVPVEYLSCPGTCGSIAARIVDGDGKEYDLCHSCIAVGAPCGKYPLPAGEELTRTFHFQGSAYDPDRLDSGCYPVCLPFGSYTLIVRFGFSVEDGSQENAEDTAAFEWNPEPVTLPPEGTWGGTGIELTLGKCGGTFIVNCGDGILSEPLILDGEGRFEGRGGLAYGPVVRPYTEMLYDGTVEGETMTLSFAVPVPIGSGAPESQPPLLGPYELTYGEKGDMQLCQ